MKQFHIRFFLFGFAFTLILTNTIAAQTAAGPHSAKNPVAVEIANQSDSPLHITLTNVDTSNERFQKVNITIQNLSEKSIRGYVLTSYPQTVGVTETRFFPRKAFLSGVVHESEICIQNENIRSSESKVSIVVDYVAYTDLTGWGDDTEQMSDSIWGQLSGTRAAAAEVTMLIKSAGLAGLEKSITPPSKVPVSTPPDSENKSEKWRSGFRLGYRGFIHFVQTRHADTDFLSQLDEAKKSVD